MKTLIILAHPSKNSFNNAVAKKIENILSKKNIQVDFLDLYENPQNFLSYENQKNPDFEPQVENIQNRISQADELIFVYPIWWSDIPAILKNFFDQNFSAGFGFKYIDGKPVGLLKGKTARVFCSAGGSKKMYEDILPHKTIMQTGRLEFCGLEVKNFTIFENISFPQTDTKNYLDYIEKILN